MDAIEKRLRDAIDCKDGGNKALGEGNVKRAAFLYKSVYLHIGDLVSEATRPSEGDGGVASMFGKAKSAKCIPPEIQKQIDDVFIASQNNLALAHLKLDRFGEALACANKVLFAAPQNLKALFRRARAFMALGMLTEAQSDLKRILDEMPNDNDTIAALAEVDHMMAESLKKEKKMFQKMFA